MQRAFWFKAQMRDQLPARQMERYVVNDARLIEDGCLTHGVEQGQIAGGKFMKRITLIDRRSAGQLKDDAVVLKSVEAGVLWHTVHSRNIAARIDGLEAVCAEGLKPTYERFRVECCKIIRTRLLLQGPPLVTLPCRRSSIRLGFGHWSSQPFAGKAILFDLVRK
jgi:hypothetical protein